VSTGTVLVIVGVVLLAALVMVLKHQAHRKKVADRFLGDPFGEGHGPCGVRAGPQAARLRRRARPAAGERAVQRSLTCLGEILDQVPSFVWKS
jgi:hypothetical protein